MRNIFLSHSYFLKCFREEVLKNIDKILFFFYSQCGYSVLHREAAHCLMTSSWLIVLTQSEKMGTYIPASKGVHSPHASRKTDCLFFSVPEPVLLVVSTAWIYCLFKILVYATFVCQLLTATVMVVLAHAARAVLMVFGTFNVCNQCAPYLVVLALAPFWL